MHSQTAAIFLFLLLSVQVSFSQRDSPVQGRYLRPATQNRPCTSTIRCPETSRDDKYPDDYKDREKARPPAGDYLEDRPSGYSDYKPKPDVRPVRRDEEDYKTKPIVGSDYDEKPREVYRPKPKDDYVPKLADDDIIPKPADYGSKPVVREEYKPVVREEYKPVVREEYKPKPPPRDEYDLKPPTRDEYKPKPVVRDEYQPKPVSRDEYVPRPVDKEEYNPRPVDKEYIPRPVDKEYIPRPVDKEHNPRPVDKDEYIPRPPDRDYVDKPAAASGGYSYPKPPSGGNKDDSGYPYKPPYDDNPKTSYDGKVDDYNEDGYDKPIPPAILENDNCICVPYYQCKDGHIVTDGAGIIDARRRPQPDEDLPLDGKFKPPSCGPFHVCCNTPESSTVKPYEHRCGVRNPSGINSRILSPSNKGEADFGEWPWQAAVLKSEGTVNIFQCGGVLIDKYHVLTVAHCVFHLYKYNDYPLKVRLGEWDTQTTSEFLAHEDYKVSKITIHPEYRNTSLWNDIAILRLQEPVLFAPHIDSICLPKYDENFAGQNCVVTGWGKDSYKGGTFSNVMKEVALQVIDNYNCEEMLRKTRLGRFFQLHEGFVCAGGEHGLDSCKGDGGGPLVCYRKDRSYALAGLVSWGIDCGQPGVPGVYVKVQKYLDWISKNTGVELQDYWPKA